MKSSSTGQPDSCDRKQELRIDTVGHGVETAREDVARAEAAAFDGLWFGEMGGDALDGVLAAATRGSGLSLGTAVTGGLVRNPMECAYRLADVRRLTSADIRLGIGAQARQVVRHQYGVEWDRPLLRLVEFRQALLSIWNSWSVSDPPSFRGQFFRHVHTPQPCIPSGLKNPPLVMLGATGSKSRWAAARYFDGLITHPCTPLKFLTDVIAPDFRSHRAAGEARPPELISMTMLICVDGESTLEQMLNEMRNRIWYWAAAGVHQPAFDYVGLKDIRKEAMAGVRRRDTTRIADIVTDDVVRAFCSIGSVSDIASILSGQLSGVVDRTIVILASDVSPIEARTLREPIGQ